MTISRKKIKKFLKEERMSAKTYANLGLAEFARDERKHADYFKKLLARGK